MTPIDWRTLWAATFAATLCVGATAAPGALPRAVRDRLEAAGIPQDALAVVVQRPADATPRFAFRADEPMAPASTIKLLTSVVALETLGPAWRGTTELGVTGEIRAATLHGDLVLKGGTDVDFDLAALRRMLLRLRLSGVERIAGDLLLDRTLFIPARMDVGLPPFDEAPEFRYNVIPDALMLGMNLVGLELVADESRLRVASTPRVEGVTFESRMTLVDIPCLEWEDHWRLPETRVEAGGKLRVMLQGRFPRNCSASTEVNVIERTRFIEAMVRALWRELGGTWRGRTREVTAAVAARYVARHRSRPLAELVRDIDKDSDNPIARSVFLMLGTTVDGTAGDTTALRAESVVRRWLAAHGMSGATLVLENGSGLSRRERISAGLLAAVIAEAGRTRWAPEFESSVPIVGVDGGMRTRLADSPASGAARIKTGTLRDASAVAGWVIAPGGERHIVVAILNHDRAVKEVARPVLDAVLDWAARGMPSD